LILLENNIFYELDKRVKIISLNESSGTGVSKLLRLPIISYNLSKIIKENDFDRVVSFLARSNYVNVLSKIFVNHKSILCERAMPSLQYQNGLSGKINKTLIKKLYPKGELCIANSIGNKIDLEKNFGIDGVISIPNPFDIPKISTLSKDSVDINSDKFSFVTVGRLDWGKNHKLIIDAVKDIDANLYIIGDGELKQYLQEYIKEHNLDKRVFLLGQKSNPFGYISKCDCFVFASSHEGFPNVLVEALCCNMPIISTDCDSGPREILSPNSDMSKRLKYDIEISEYGILTPIKDKENLKKAMNLIIDDKELRDSYNTIAIDRAKEFEAEKIIKQFEEVICVE
jgi:N-acetylgalactosamine-N,N'-diacetylbacillosaminyl-diphospho-undecaprenol 4-alpha-N-acetylgalactosaminyltransferase